MPPSCHRSTAQADSYAILAELSLRRGTVTGAVEAYQYMQRGIDILSLDTVMEEIDRDLCHVEKDFFVIWNAVCQRYLDLESRILHLPGSISAKSQYVRTWKSNAKVCS
jgi:hypothetical protein